MNAADLLDLLRGWGNGDSVNIIVRNPDGATRSCDIVGVQRVFDIVPPGQMSRAFVAVVVKPS